MFVKIIVSNVILSLCVLFLKFCPATQLLLERDYYFLLKPFNNVSATTFQSQTISIYVVDFVVKSTLIGRAKLRKAFGYECFQRSSRRALQSFNIHRACSVRRPRVSYELSQYFKFSFKCASMKIIIVVKRYTQYTTIIRVYACK